MDKETMIGSEILDRNLKKFANKYMWPFGNISQKVHKLLKPQRNKKNLV